MPAVSKKQERFMQAVAHSPKFAKKVGVPQSVGREFTKKEGGEMKEPKAMMKKEVSFMKKKGAPKSMIKHEMAEAGMKHGGKAKKMAQGGYAPSSKEERAMPRRAESMNMKSGGKAYARGGGIEIKGKTRGKMVKMMGGGKAC